jgi:hypothetical protein
MEGTACGEASEETKPVNKMLRRAAMLPQKKQYIFLYKPDWDVY